MQQVCILTTSPVTESVKDWVGLSAYVVPFCKLGEEKGPL